MRNEKKNALPKKKLSRRYSRYVVVSDWEKTKINKFWSINCQYVSPNWKKKIVM